MSRSLRLATLVWLGAAACGGNSDTKPDASDTDAPPAIDAGPSAIALSFTRDGQELDAVAHWVDADGTAVAGPAISIAADHGAVGAATTSGLDTTAHLVPGGTGVFVVTASSGSVSEVRTAVVLDEVDDEWDQPELVRGVVNTAGWEDGPSVSPDGQTLVLQYLPVPIDCLQSGDASSAACKVIGPIGAPERPNLPGASRVNADGTFHNGCPSAALDPLPNTIVVPPNAQWAFSRQPDGSFGDPRPVFYDGIDGCISSFGLIIGPDNKVSWAIDSPTPPDDGPKIRSGSLDLGAATKLGTFANVGGTLELDDQPGTELAFGEALGEGNPFVMTNADGTRTALFDDEGGRQDLMFATELGTGTNTWSAVTVIPAPVSDPTAQESQPFFDDHTLLFRRDLTLLASDWSGGDMGDAASWSATRTILAPDTSASPPVGAILAVGEPSVATVNGKKELYFVFAVRLADHLNLDVAVVHAR